MPPEKPWKFDAIMRLLLSVCVCFFAGGFLIAALQQARLNSPGHAKTYVLVFSSLVCLAATLWLLRRPWRIEDGLMRSVMVMGLFYVGLVLGAWAAKVVGPIKPSLLQMIVSVLSLQGALLILLGGFLREHDTNWQGAFGLRHRWPVAIGGGFLLACGYLPFAWMLQEASAWLMTRLHLRPQLQEVVQTLQAEHATTERLIFGAITLLVVPVAEEVFFRGILYTWIRGLGYRRLALWGTSVAFAAVHNNLAAFLPLTLLALGLAVVYEATGNLLAPIAAHAVFNGANLAKYYLLEHFLHR